MCQKLEAPEPTRALRSALTIAGAYAVGGLIPLSPYILSGSVASALRVSIGVTLLALFVFGTVKGRFTGIHPLRGGAQTVLIGGLAAGAAFALARLLG
jgi:vacuolar iron transporter family protein